MTPIAPFNARQKLTLVFYSLLWLILTPFTFIHFGWKYLTRKPGYNRSRLSRYGLLFGKKIRKDGLLLHCASVGEVVATQTLVERILKANPEQVITISTTTTTGAERVTLLFADRVNHVYFPYDFPIFINAFLKKIRPNKVLINEMELWPNFCKACSTRGIPAYLINGRMSDKSKATYKKFPNLFLPMFNCFETICAQGQRDYDNYLELGIAPNRVILTNNIKFDLSFSDTDLHTANTIKETFDIGKKVILVGASTHDPEEQLLLDAYLQLSQHYPNLLLILVPRHPQRFEKVHQLLTSQKIQVNLMSEAKACSNSTQVLLCNQMGKLRSIYALADIAFVGGSLAEKGGHNALEPAAVGVPIIMGPSRYNNPAICAALESAKALVNVEGSADIVAACHEWLTHPKQRIAAGKAGENVLQENGGAIDKTLEIIK
ncbi:3-deoxy-D-manno-octulosonic acid transferase [Paraglaciecola sp. 2405UD69-4]|uniref:3-deoxy-D-manno-octulosonic acid transferase n=1 Tax=Paraglaciecola sp. 2405UD69-4 TaxID=3391836 RepID=UPI0039C9718B